MADRIPVRRVRQDRRASIPAIRQAHGLQPEVSWSNVLARDYFKKEL